MVHEFASSEELYFSWYLQELEEAGYIYALEYQPKAFKICDPVKVSYTVYGKRKGFHLKDVTLLQGSEYTADWSWFWGEKAYNIFFAADPNLNPKLFPFIANKRLIRSNYKYFSVIDVKGNFDPNNNIRMFSMNQKIIYKLYAIYVQGIVPKPSVKIKLAEDEKTATKTIQPKSALFYSSFTPKRYLLTDETMKERKILFETKSLNQFVNEQLNKLEALSGQMQAKDQEPVR